VRALVVGVGPLLLAPSAYAQSAPESRTSEYSSYEQQSVRDALAASGREADPSPEGKLIEDFDIVNLDIIEKRDPAPRLLNIIHTTTRPYVVRREILLAKGEPFSQVLCDETARNLRQLHQLSLVACVAERGSRPDRVRVLVVAKDVWSLRLNSEFRLAAGKIEYLSLHPSEENLFGAHHGAALQFALEPSSYELGARYVVRRLLGSRVALTASGGLIFHRDSGDVEGSYGSLSVGQPLFSTRTQWAWTVPVSWRYEVTRRYVDAAPSFFRGAIPYQYRSHLVAATPSITRSFGWALKHDLTAGVEATRRAFVTDDLSGYDPSMARDFVDRAVPVGDTRVGPFVQWRSYTTSFLRALEFETLGLQEDFRLGHDLFVRAWPSVEAIGSSRNVFGVTAGAQYTWPLLDGLARIGIESTNDHDLDRGAISDGLVRASTRLMTPRLGFGRIVFDTTWLHRYRNYLNRTTYLGGDGRLRGYPTRYFVGKDVVAYNLEFRTRAVEILTLQAGAAVFYDVGDAFDGFGDMRIKHSVGVGLRALFPQLDKMVLRVDLGFPLTPGYVPAQGFPGQIIASFGQAFSVPAVAPR